MKIRKHTLKIALSIKSDSSHSTHLLRFSRMSGLVKPCLYHRGKFWVKSGYIWIGPEGAFEEANHSRRPID